MNAVPRLRPPSLATPADDTLVVQRIEDTATFEALRPEWNELLQASAANCVSSASLASRMAGSRCRCVISSMRWPDSFGSDLR